MRRYPLFRRGYPREWGGRWAGFRPRRRYRELHHGGRDTTAAPWLLVTRLWDRETPTFEAPVRAFFPWLSAASANLVGRARWASQQAWGGFLALGPQIRSEAQGSWAHGRHIPLYPYLNDLARDYIPFAWWGAYNIYTPWGQEGP